jgi:hypothetical protein
MSHCHIFCSFSDHIHRIFSYRISTLLMSSRKRRHRSASPSPSGSDFEEGHSSSEYSPPHHRSDMSRQKSRSGRINVEQATASAYADRLAQTASGSSHTDHGHLFKRQKTTSKTNIQGKGKSCQEALKGYRSPKTSSGNGSAAGKVSFQISTLNIL